MSRMRGGSYSLARVICPEQIRRRLTLDLARKNDRGSFERQSPSLVQGDSGLALLVAFDYFAAYSQMR